MGARDHLGVVGEEVEALLRVNDELRAVVALKVTKYVFRGAAVAHRIRLRLPSCHPGSSPKHTINTFIIYSIRAIFAM